MPSHQNPSGAAQLVAVIAHDARKVAKVPLTLHTSRHFHPPPPPSPPPPPPSPPPLPPSPPPPPRPRRQSLALQPLKHPMSRIRLPHARTKTAMPTARSAPFPTNSRTIPARAKNNETIKHTFVHSCSGAGRGGAMATTAIETVSHLRGARGSGLTTMVAMVMSSASREGVGSRGFAWACAASSAACVADKGALDRRRRSAVVAQACEVHFLQSFTRREAQETPVAYS